MKEPKMPSWEEGYYLGKEFIEDSKKINCRIEVYIFSPALLDDFVFYLYKTKISVCHNSSGLIVYFDYKISNKLLYYIKNNFKNGNCEKHVIAIIAKFLPQLNHKILNQRYIKGHPLAKTFSIFDISRIIINRGTSKEKIVLSWPIVFDNFPPAYKGKWQSDEIFFRDWIDSMHAYFNGNFDECVRKVITSVENFFVFKKFKRKKRFLFFKSGKYFNDVVHQNIYDNRDLSRKVIANNLTFIYKVRCKIVHDKLRLDYRDIMFCKKAVHSLFYLYQSLADNQLMQDYVFSLGQQFLMLDTEYGYRSVYDLEKMERVENNSTDDKILSHKEFDKSIYESLRVNKKEQEMILRKRQIKSENYKR